MRPDPSTKLSSTPSEYLTAYQLEALKTSDIRKQHEADDRALAEGILASLQMEAEASKPASEKSSMLTKSPASTSTSKSKEHIHSEKQPAPASKKIPLQEEHYKANRKLAGQLHSWLDNHGFEVIKNKGGNDATSCLLISLIQHAKGNYASEHQGEVEHLRKKLNEQTSKKNPDNPDSNRYSLYADGWEIKWLVDQANQENQKNGRTLSVYIVSADADGKPSYSNRIGDGKNPVIIFDQGGHFEAVVPKGTIR